MFEHEKGLKTYKAQIPLQRELFSISVSTVSELLKCLGCSLEFSSRIEHSQYSNIPHSSIVSIVSIFPNLNNSHPRHTKKGARPGPVALVVGLFDFMQLCTDRHANAM